MQQCQRWPTANITGSIIRRVLNLAYSQIRVLALSPWGVAPGYGVGWPSASFVRLK